MSVSDRVRRGRPPRLEEVRGAAGGALGTLDQARLACGRALRRLGPLRVAAVLLAACVLGATWLWFRGSSLVAVNQVTVTGITGADSGRIRSALTAAAQTMTTLDVQMSRLYTAVSPYPAVKALRVTTDFPHGMRIRVVEELPAAVLTAGGSRIMVSADGAVLRSLSTSRALPVIPVRALPVGPRLSDSQAQQELAVVSAAPAKLRTRVTTVLDTSTHGVVVELRAGPSLYFGSSNSVAPKWIAAMAVLANPGSAGASYIDLSDPSRPAAG